MSQDVLQDKKKLDTKSVLKYILVESLRWLMIIRMRFQEKNGPIIQSSYICQCTTYTNLHPSPINIYWGKIDIDSMLGQNFLSQSVSSFQFQYQQKKTTLLKWISIRKLTQIRFWFTICKKIIAFFNIKCTFSNVFFIPSFT